ncbi:hypothetical protein [Sphingomonas crusticola]|uniref:hypothetical protein n=1 Tax=Sphingomonas crusticola TaxID=1697973 RepID=UPI0013C34581|nr:hypothetical protein [Sphingomonas crusticola]
MKPAIVATDPSNIANGKSNIRLARQSKAMLIAENRQNKPRPIIGSAIELL